MEKLLFLGTNAAGVSPRFQTDLADRFDKNVRRNSSALLDGHTLIDCGPSCLNSLHVAGIEYGQIDRVLLTHLHGDHFQPSTLAALAEGRSEPLPLYLRADAKPAPIPNVEFIPMEPYQSYEIGPYTVTGLPANHEERACPQHPLIEENGKKLFYGLDGGWFRNGTYLYLKKAGLTLAVLDATVGDYVGDHRMAEHNSFPMLRLMLPSLKTVGIINDDTKIWLSHLAPSLHAPHDETVEIAARDGMNVAYDGLEITI